MFEMTLFWCACGCISKLGKILWNRSFNLLEWRLKPKLYRNSPQMCSTKRGVLRNFTKFTGKHLCQSPFFNNVAGLRPATLLKNGLWHWYLPVNFAKFLRTLFLQNTSGRLLRVISYCLFKSGTLLEKVSYSGLVVGKMSLKNKSLFT